MTTYDPDTVIHVAEDGFYGGSAYCGYVFDEDTTRSGRFAEYCPDCVDVLGYIPDDGPLDEDDDEDEEEDDDDD